MITALIGIAIGLTVFAIARLSKGPTLGRLPLSDPTREAKQEQAAQARTRLFVANLANALGWIHADSNATEARGTVGGREVFVRAGRLSNGSNVLRVSTELGVRLGYPIGDPSVVERALNSMGIRGRRHDTAASGEANKAMKAALLKLEDEHELDVARFKNLMVSPSLALVEGLMVMEIVTRFSSSKDWPRQVELFASSADSIASLTEKIPEALFAATAEAHGYRARLTGLTSLTALFPEHAVTDRALEWALRHSDGGLRVLAATKRGGPDVQEVLADVATAIVEPANTRIRAIRQLEKRADSELVTRVMLQLLKERHNPNLKNIAVHSLASQYHPDILPAFLALLEESREGLRIPVLQALRRRRDAAADAEAAVIKTLLHPNPEVVSEAVDTLAVIGTLDSIEPLKSLFDGGFVDETFQLGVETAIYCIRDRVGVDLEGGRLSISSAGSDGQLSLGSEGGAVSLSDDATGKDA